jgi:prevent-host-death family protein
VAFRKLSGIGRAIQLEIDITAAIVSRVIQSDMTEITIRDLRNHGGKVVDRVALGEHLTVTRDGKPVALLLPLEPPPLSSRALAFRWAALPSMDPDSLRRDVDEVLDQTL